MNIHESGTSACLDLRQEQQANSETRFMIQARATARDRAGSPSIAAFLLVQRISEQHESADGICNTMQYSQRTHKDHVKIGWFL